MGLDQNTLDSLRLPTPVLIISGDVENPMIQRVREAFSILLAKGSPDLDLIIDSNGGSTVTGLDIYDIIRLYPGKITGKVMGNAASMAAIILQACKVRQCALHSEILIHHVSRRNVSLDIMKSKKKRDKVIAEMEKPQKRLYDILLQTTKQTKAAIVKACRLNKQMSAEEALAFGLIDQII